MMAFLMHYAFGNTVAARYVAQEGDATMFHSELKPGQKICRCNLKEAA